MTSKACHKHQNSLYCITIAYLWTGNTKLRYLRVYLIPSTIYEKSDSDFNYSWISASMSHWQSEQFSGRDRNKISSVLRLHSNQITMWLPSLVLIKIEHTCCSLHLQTILQLLLNVSLFMFRLSWKYPGGREWHKTWEAYRLCASQSSQQKQVLNDSRNFYSSATCSFTQLPLGCTRCASWTDVERNPWEDHRNHL